MKDVNEETQNKLFGGCFNLVSGNTPAGLQFVHLNLSPYLTTGFGIQTRTETLKKTIKFDIVQKFEILAYFPFVYIITGVH